MDQKQFEALTQEVLNSIKIFQAPLRAIAVAACARVLQRRTAD
jgi:hypothetical protein